VSLLAVTILAVYLLVGLVWGTRWYVRRERETWLLTAQRMLAVLDDLDDDTLSRDEMQQTASATSLGSSVSLRSMASDDLRSSLRAAVRTWLLTAQQMIAILDEESLSRDEMLERLEVEQAECLRAMGTVEAELEQARDE
jgi:hypothetical protein